MIVAVVLITSCSEDLEPSMPSSDIALTSRSAEIQQDKGRFDEESFKWDYSFSTDSVQENEGLIIYPVLVVEPTNTQSRSTNGGRTTTRPGCGGTGNHRPSIGTPTTTDQMLIIDPNIVYVGAAFPESTFAKDYSKELVYPRNPIDVYFNTPTHI